MAEIVAQQLRLRIVSGELQDGDVLPRESDRVEEFGVSRPSLREAVRILETEGLLRIRRGKIGGAVISRPSAESAAYHLGLSLQARGTTLEDVAAAWEVLEPTCAVLVAELPDGVRAGVVAVLTDLVDENETQIEEQYDFTAGALRFHAAIVQHCGNESIALLTSALEAVWSSQERRWAEAASVEGGYPLATSRREVIAAHRRIVRAIAENNAAAAGKAAREHLAHSQQYVGLGTAAFEVLAGGS